MGRFDNPSLLTIRLHSVHNISCVACPESNSVLLSLSFDTDPHTVSFTSPSSAPLTNGAATFPSDDTSLTELSVTTTETTTRRRLFNNSGPRALILTLCTQGPTPAVVASGTLELKTVRACKDMTQMDVKLSSLTGAFVRMSVLMTVKTSPNASSSSSSSFLSAGGSIDRAALGAIVSKGVGRMGMFVTDSVNNVNAKINNNNITASNSVPAQPELQPQEQQQTQIQAQGQMQTVQEQTQEQQQQQQQGAGARFGGGLRRMLTGVVSVATEIDPGTYVDVLDTAAVPQEVTDAVTGLSQGVTESFDVEVQEEAEVSVEQEFICANEQAIPEAEQEEVEDPLVAQDNITTREALENEKEEEEKEEEIEREEAMDQLKNEWAAATAQEVLEQKVDDMKRAHEWSSNGQTNSVAVGPQAGNNSGDVTVGGGSAGGNAQVVPNPGQHNVPVSYVEAYQQQAVQQHNHLQQQQPFQQQQKQQQQRQQQQQQLQQQHQWPQMQIQQQQQQLHQNQQHHQQPNQPHQQSQPFPQMQMQQHPQHPQHQDHEQPHDITQHHPQSSAPPPPSTGQQQQQHQQHQHQTTDIQAVSQPQHETHEMLQHLTLANTNDEPNQMSPPQPAALCFSILAAANGMCMGSVTVPFDSLTNAQGTGQRFELQGVGGMPGGHFVLHVQPAAVNHTTTTTTITTTTQGGMQSNGNVQQQMQTKAQKGGFGGALMGGGAGVGAMAAAGMMKRIPKFWNNA